MGREAPERTEGTAAAPERRTRDRILLRLKLRGPQTAARLAAWLGLTPMGARQHLARLGEQGLVAYEDVRRGVGRPARSWQLTAAGSARFPQGYADLAVDLVGAVRRAFGSEGLEKLVAERTRAQLEVYRKRVPADAPLPRRVAALAQLRREEGYMAEWARHRDGTCTLVENHCPICAAAEVCQGLCAGELELFRTILGEDVEIERVEHILAGARRCVYRIRPGKDGGPRLAVHERGGGERRPGGRVRPDRNAGGRLGDGAILAAERRGARGRGTGVAPAGRRPPEAKGSHDDPFHGDDPDRARARARGARLGAAGVRAGLRQEAVRRRRALAGAAEGRQRAVARHR